MTAVKVATVTNQQDMLIITSLAVVTDIVVCLQELSFPFWNFDDFGCSIGALADYLRKISPTTRAIAGSCCPSLNAIAAELMLTSKHSFGFREFAKTYGANLFIQ